MNTMRPQLALPQLGVSLVELMIALAIGLVVSLVATTGYLSGLKVQSTETDTARVDESARFGFMLLGNEIKKAGFHDQNKGLGSPFMSADSVVAVDGQNGTLAANNFSDSLTVSYYGENDFAQPATDTADGRILDCLGNAISRDMRVTENLYVADDPDNVNEPTLYCAVTYFPGAVAGHAAAPACDGAAVGAGGSVVCTPVPLIPGVESMKLVYGEFTGGKTIMVNRYVPMSDVTNRGNILSVMVSLVVRTANGNTKINLDTAAKDISHFGGNFVGAGFQYTPPVDGRMRFPFSTTIAVRNFGG